MRIHHHECFSKMTAMRSVTSITDTFAIKLLPVSSNARTFRRYSNQALEKFAIVVIGGGIVGSASARELILRHPQLNIALIEKEKRFGCHQTGNNSGVIHAGMYYKPGSLKAKLCVKGMNSIYKYCDDKGVKYIKNGKLIVATENYEVPTLLDLYERGVKNGVKDMKLIDGDGIRKIQPLCKGMKAIWSPHTGVVNFAEVAQSYVEDFNKCGGKSFLNFEVKKFLASEDADFPVVVSDEKSQKILAKYVLTCCGLHSDTVAVLTGCPEDPKIIPFRGEYLYLNTPHAILRKTNIYPVPDPRFPFLGVHITPQVDGRIILGPNAILAYCKEGYKYSDFNLREMKDILLYSGFRKLAMKYVGFGLKEMTRSVFISLQVKQIQKFVQEISTSEVERGLAGVRAQAMTKDGVLLEDFAFDSQPGSGNVIGKRVLHCRNAPSPGATSSLTIAEMIADKMENEFKIKSSTK